VAATPIYAALQRTTQFAVAATNRSALSSHEIRSHEVRSNEMKWAIWTILYTMLSGRRQTAQRYMSIYAI